MKSFSIRNWTLFSILILMVSAAWIWMSKVPPGEFRSVRPPLPHPGFPAPDFTLLTPDGEQVSLANLHGQPVIINLWASWCPPCRAEMPALQSVYEAYQDQGLVILALNATNQDSLQAALEFTRDLGLEIPILLDPDGRVSSLYQLRSLPTTFFVDPEGVIRDVVIGGPMAEALLRVRVEQLLEEEG